MPPPYTAQNVPTVHAGGRVQHLVLHTQSGRAEAANRFAGLARYASDGPPWSSCASVHAVNADGGAATIAARLVQGEPAAPGLPRPRGALPIKVGVMVAGNSGESPRYPPPISWLEGLMACVPHQGLLLHRQRAISVYLHLRLKWQPG